MPNLETLYAYFVPIKFIYASNFLK